MVRFFLGGCNSSDPEPLPEPVKSTATDILNLTPDFIAVSGLEPGAEYEVGSTQKVILTPGTNLSDGFQDYHMEHIHIQVNDKVYMPSFTGNSGESLQSVAVEVVIPEENFEVVACYSVQQQLSENGYTMRLEENEFVSLYGVSPDARYKYFDCYLLTTDAYTITEVLFQIGDGEWLSVDDVKGCSCVRSESVNNVYQISIYPDYQDVTGDVTLRVEGEQHGRYNITWENATATYLDLEKSVLPAMAIDGETVTAELYVNSSYYLAGAEASVSGLDVEVISRAYVKFEMPAENVTIDLNILEKIPVTCIESAHITEAQFYDAPDQYYGVPVQAGIPGEYVYLFASAEEGFKPMKATLEGGESFDFVYYAPGIFYASVLIPGEAVSLSAEIEVSPAYSVTAVDGVTVVFNGGNLFAEGETVSMSIYVPDGQRISSVTVTDSNGLDVPVVLDLPYASFVMPASNVEVSVAYEALGGGNTVTVKAYFDDNNYDVSSSTNYDWDFAEGFTIDRGATFYMDVYNYTGEMFYVGVKIGDSVTVYPADFDDMMGEYSFGRALVADGDIVIKVGATEEEIAF